MFYKLKRKITDFIIDDLTKRRFFSFLTDKQMIYSDYFFTYGKLPNLGKPVKFTEKLEWLKLYGKLERFAKYTDKFEVRSYVEKIIGKKHLIPLLGVWNKFEEIDFDKLPKKFVLKATHGSYYNFICKDKSKIDKKKLAKTFKKWLSENFYDKAKETQYRYLKPKIICEKYMEDEHGELRDYKFFCSNGVPVCVEIHKGRFSSHKLINLDLNWKKLPIRIAPESRNIEEEVEKPKNFKEMISIAKKLSKDFPFVRVDLYSVNNRTYFGELTFTPASGLFHYQKEEMDYFQGRLIDITKY